MRTEIQKTILIVIILSLNTVGFSQSTTTIYLFHGQGSDQRIFDSLVFDSIYSIERIHYDIPEKGATMESFARQLSKQIDTTKPFILIGMSLGGMLCAELQEIMDPEMVVLISSAQNRSELPFRYRFQRIIPLYEIIPAPWLLAGAKWVQTFTKLHLKPCLVPRNPGISNVLSE
jgi:pimeloyl-ACP methyl ester carboxylesterase